MRYHNIRLRWLLLIAAFCLPFHSIRAQVGQHRSDFAVGVNGGWVLSNVGFTPTVSQKMHQGPTAGLSFRYVCEKYFSTICSVYAEFNYAQLGWTEDILDAQDDPVVNAQTGLPEEYSRSIGYVQMPIFAHLAWGKENKGMQFFFQVGPQFGLYTNESTTANFALADMNYTDRINKTCAQDTMSVENKFDYGIAVGAGAELTLPKLGHFLLEGRYYYGLGNIYGDSKRDYFAKSNFGNIILKLTYLFDITKTK